MLDGIIHPHGEKGKDKTETRNGGVEEAESFKKNGPILYFSGSLAGQF